MFTYLAKSVLHSRSPTSICRFLECPSLLVRFISSDSTNQINSFTVSYLINSCGLTQEQAISTSKNVHFETSTKPDAVLTLLKNHGFSNTHVLKIIQKSPQILVWSADKKLKPKLDFLESIGLSGLDLGKALSNNPAILRRSLHKAIIPSFDLLKTLFHYESTIISMLKHGIELLQHDPQQRLVPNVKLLRAYGVPDSSIQCLFTQAYQVIIKAPQRFKMIVEDVKKMKVDPSRTQFVLILKAFVYMSKKSLEAKFNVYRKWGWSEDDILCAFRKQPFCMMISEKNIMCTMEYLVNKAGYDPLLIAKIPSILLYSVERRIIPRCSVIQLLIANGLVGKDQNLFCFLSLTEKRFLKDFVAKFEEQMPEVLNVYQGKGRPLV